MDGKKPRDVCGNDMSVPAMLMALIQARAEGRAANYPYVERLAKKNLAEYLREAK